MKPKNLEKVEQNERKKATGKNKVESTLLRKRNKKEPIQVAFRLKGDERLDKMKELEQKGHNTPVKWINQEKNMILTKRKDGLKRATSQSLRNKMKNGME